ncbi:sensor histidine kinase [Paenibacillus sp. IB182496]|uniref:Sensor histidine kinase n=2 Tax=Paenibacillus sabuli TaxID=2772509 RepID=A0A927BP09_9BACL|nr:sensor histidine kinase [Paenibacillus sabuli]
MIVISTLIPLLALGFFAYRTASGISEEKAKQSGLNTLRQLEIQMGLMIEDIENMSVFLIGNDEIQRYLVSEDELVPQTAIVGFLTNLAFSKKYIANIVIDADNGKPSIAQTAILDTGKRDISDTQPDYYATHAKWWSSLYEDRTTGGVKRVISLVRPIGSTIDTFRRVGKLTISLNQETLEELLLRSELENGGYVLLLDGEGRVMAGPSDDLLYRPLREAFPGMQAMPGQRGAFTHAREREPGGERERSTILYQQVDRVGWTLVGVIPFEEYSAQNRYVLTLTAVAVCMAVLLSVGLVLFLIQRVTRPLTALVRFLKRASPDEPIPMLPVAAIDEVGQVIVNYNRLTQRIERLTDEVKQGEALKKEADLQALQAQINPHFLYNTLSSIHWLALLDRDERIAEMVGSLSDFLQFSLNSGEEMCLVEQEIEHVRSYVSIQSIRYPDQFDVRIRAQEAARPHAMLKLLLQPLIENAMLHGILKRERPGRITVAVRLSGASLHYAVEDDGVGMDGETLKRLRADIAPHEPGALQPYVPGRRGSYGLRNVNTRLQLHYGPEAGLSIESEAGRGTRVSFAIPTADQRRGEGA